ncbi:Hypothetical protein FKW44_007030, partial [Caligus rogercresseyi]
MKVSMNGVGRMYAPGQLCSRRAYKGPNMPLGGCQRLFMFLEASSPPGIVPVLPVATPPLKVS